MGELVTRWMPQRLDVTILYHDIVAEYGLT